jgi:hypothetical protein
VLRQSGTRERLERSWRERSEEASGLRSSVHTSPFPGAQTHGGSTFAHEMLLLLGPRDRRMIITQGAALPWRDPSSNHNRQHHAALEMS